MGIFKKNTETTAEGEHEKPKAKLTKEDFRAALAERAVSQAEKADSKDGENQEKLRAKLTDKGYDLTGCLRVDKGRGDAWEEKIGDKRMLNEFGTQYLLIFQDRVEFHSSGLIPGFDGKNIRVVQLSQISAIQTKRFMLSNSVVVHTSNGKGFIHISEGSELIRKEISDLMGAPQSTAAVASEPDPTVQLAKLADLHKAGVLTDEEFATKKAELLKRI